MATHMTQKQKSVTERARNSVEKAAYVAVGAPAAALKALNARISDLRDTVKSSRRELSDGLAAEIDEWITEGEEIVEDAWERLRCTGIVEDLRESVRATKEAAEVGIDKATGVDRSSETMAPDEELTVISGVGPANASKLGKAGIIGISRFLERTETRRDLEKLAATTGISANTIAGWRHQVDLGRIEGVGASHLRLLHRVGIWTIDQLAAASPQEISDELRSLDLPARPDPMPTETLIRQWRANAKRVSAGRPSALGQDV